MLKYNYKSFSYVLSAMLMSCFIISPVMALKLKKSSFSDLPDFGKTNMVGAINALKLSCSDLLRRARYHSYPSDIRYQKNYLNTCKKVKAFNNLTNSNIKQFILNNYKPYLILDSENGAKLNYTGVFTGYYQPSILGSLTRTNKFDVPIYARPKMLKKIDLGDVNSRMNGTKSYRMKNSHGGYYQLPDRAAISKGPMLKNAKVLAWVESKVDRFFLQIQGSGTIVLPNKKSLLLGYNGQNGHPYYAIGKYLVESGDIPKTKISMQSIVAWLKSHPKDRQRVMNLNPSFVFFKVLSQKTPNGAQGLPLTAKHSLAVDKSYVPLGSLLWLSTRLPKLDNGHTVAGIAFNQLMVAQDTGGAIKGPVRGDVFWGMGKEAKFLAGHMNSKGKYWMLIPKGVRL